jgi:excinuclease UvrABC ATPase subunit
LTEIDDYLRLLFAKLGDSYCYSCGKIIKPQTVEQIMDKIHGDYMEQKIYLLQESGVLEAKEDLNEFVKKNRNRVEKGKGFTRYLLVGGAKSAIPPKKNESENIETKEKEAKIHLEPIEYFYLETPNVPDNYFPLNIYGIYDRITVSEEKLGRLKEDIIKIL